MQNVCGKPSKEAAKLTKRLNGDDSNMQKQTDSQQVGELE
jgi:hypothetical protein